MTAQPATRPTAGSRTTRTAAGPLPRPTRPATRARGRALLVALGLALAATVLPMAAAHASPQAPDPVSTGSDSIPTPQRVDAGFGGTAAGPHQAAGLALIAAAIVLTLLIIVIARRHQAEARSNR
jgi:hypothetical protein